MRASTFAPALLRKCTNINLVSVVLLLWLTASLLTGCTKGDKVDGTIQTVKPTPHPETQSDPELRKQTEKNTSDQSNCWHRIPGQIGHADQYGSGWLDLATMSDFKKDEQLRITVGGSAQKVVVRLLSRRDSPDSASGILGVFSVPKNKSVLVTIDGDYSGVIQLSVHGGSNPWNMFPLGGGNGPATLIKAETGCQ
jgi:hypothetical protein